MSIITIFYLYGMKDNFSTQASLYSKYRPSYPPELFNFLLSNVNHRETAWDCATGNGQTAKELASHFKQIFATDISQKQLDNAYKAGNIIYSKQPAEQTNFSNHQFDLITISQALHWFNFDNFFTEVRRVGKPGSWIAAWTYPLLRVNANIDIEIEEFHYNTLEKYWDEERKYVDQNYTTIPFPFNEIKTPVFSIEYHWTLEDFEGFFNTWSAVQKYIAANSHNPVHQLIKSVQPHWQGEKMKIIFPIYMRMGRL